MANRSINTHAALAIALLLCWSATWAGPPATTASGAGDFQDQADVGSVDPPGSAVFDSLTRVYRVKASGDNIWNKQDAFHFLYRKTTGDLSVTADIAWAANGGNAHRKAGLMFRQTLKPDSIYADVMVHGDGLISLQYRSEPGGDTREIKSTIKAPATVRLERHGDAFTLLVAPTGGAFQSVGTLKLPMHSPVYAGLAVCSHDPKVSEIAVFSNVSMSSQATKKERNTVPRG